MFGNSAAFVNSNMFAGLWGNDLFVRLPEERIEELLKEEGAARFEPMKGRPMKGYVLLPRAWLADPSKVNSWVKTSFEWAVKLPPK